MRLVRYIVVALVVVLAACSSTRRGGYYEDDGPPRGSVDVSRVPDAVPRAEPLSRTGNNPYEVFGQHYIPLRSATGFRQRGVASWYGKKFHGQRTSSGEPYDMYTMTAAHTVLPLPSYAQVTNLENGRRVVVRVNDRGPFKSNRVMDLSYAAAVRLDMLKSGTALVEIVVIDGTQKTAGTPEAATVSGGRARLYIQLGAFANPDTARRLKQRLEEAGFGTPLMLDATVGGLHLTRVRYGPLDSVASADARLDALHAAGFNEARYMIDKD